MVAGADLKFPHTPNNPSGGTTIQVGAGGKVDEEVVIPPGTLVFNKRSKATGRGVNRVPAGDHTYDNTSKLIGVSMDGIVDPASAKKHPESAGRYSVAVSGSVTIFAAIKADGADEYSMPNVLDTLYVDLDKASPRNVPTHTNDLYAFPYFTTTKSDTCAKIGVVHWVNDNFKHDGIAEVRVHLDIF